MQGKHAGIGLAGTTPMAGSRIRKGRHLRRSFRLPAVPRLPVIPLGLAAAVFAGSLLVGAVSAGANAVQPVAAPITVSGTGRPAVALRAALGRVRGTSEGQFTLASAGLSSQARRADSALVAGINKVERQAGTLDLADDNMIETADTVSAAGQGTTVVTIVPGATLTISSTRVVLDISPQDVTDLENGAALGSGIASLVGAILNVAGVNGGSAITAIVASSLTVGSDVLKLCAGNDGGAVILSVSAPANRLPSASACGVSV